MLHHHILLTLLNVPSAPSAAALPAESSTDTDTSLDSVVDEEPYVAFLDGIAPPTARKSKLAETGK